MTRRHCPGVYVGTDAEAWPRRDLRILLKCLKHGGKRLSEDEFRALCTEERAKGRDVFPLDGCTHVGADGRCTGWSGRRVYVATSFGRWRDAADAHQALHSAGHTPTSEFWVGEAKRLSGECAAVPIGDPRRRHNAERDIAGVREADALFLLVPEAGGCGCWVELGVALERRIPILAIGAGDLALERTLFCELPAITRVTTVEDAIQRLGDT